MPPDTDIHIFPNGLDQPSVCERHQSAETVAKDAPARRLCNMCALESHVIGSTAAALVIQGREPSETVADSFHGAWPEDELEAHLALCECINITWADLFGTVVFAPGYESIQSLLSEDGSRR